MVAISEGMDIVACTGFDVAQRSANTRFFARKVFRCCEFHIRSIAFEGRNGQSRPFGERGIVSKIVSTFPRGSTMGFENSVETKSLWRLRDTQPCAIRCRLYTPGIVDLLDS